MSVCDRRAQCISSVLADNTPCNDGVFCNGPDRCLNATCSVHAGDPCLGGPDCARTCSEATDTCYAALGAPCSDDGNACTVDGCNGRGACQHGWIGVCTQRITCTGSGKLCPSDTTKTSGTPCTDDGNVCTLDQCDGSNVTCQHQAVTNGTPCPDGLFCNRDETCQGGRCQSGPDPCPVLCNEASDQCATGCQPAPQTCRAAAKSILVAKDNSDDSKDRLVWKWIRGAATTLAEFGDPTATADYALCVYTGTASNLVGEAIVPANASKWRLAGTTKYLHTDTALTADGIQKVLLKSGEAQKARTLVKGKGIDLPDLTPPVADPVTVQLINGDNGVCWGASYTGAQLLQNRAGQLKAKAP